MMETISVILIAMGFGGIMQGSGQMEALVKPIAAKIRAAGGMIALTIVTCMGVNIVLPEQYLAIMVPGQMYSAEYDRRGIDRLTLGNVLGAGASVTSPLVPWNTCGMYMSSILSVGVVEYLPFAFFNYLMPLFFLVYFFIVGGKRFPAQGKA
jgi:NhaC family Na+:H+ antiporter